MKKLSPKEIIRRVGEFAEWEEEKAFMAFRKDIFAAYDALTEEEQEEALTKIIIFLAGLVPVDHLKGLEQAAISKRAERLKEYKGHIEDLLEEDAERILKELAILEKIRAQD